MKFAVFAVTLLPALAMAAGVEPTGDKFIDGPLPAVDLDTVDFEYESASMGILNGIAPATCDDVYPYRCYHGGCCHRESRGCCPRACCGGIGPYFCGINGYCYRII